MQKRLKNLVFSIEKQVHRGAEHLCNCHYMPPIADIAAEYDVLTAEYSIVRLHGPDRQGIEEQTGGLWNEIVEPKGDGLRATASIIGQNTDKVIKSFVNVNNHYEGCATLTIQRLLKLM
jgi:hypothetical protein